MPRSPRPLLAAVAALLLSPAAGGAADVRALLHELRARYESADDLTARFVQTSRLVAAGLDREVSGRVVLKKGGKMRWTYEGEDPQEIVSDGKTLWIHQVRDKNVMRQDLRNIPASNRLALDLLSGFQGVTDVFHAGACGEACVELRPKQARPDLSRVVLELDRGSRTVRSVTTEDPLGNRTRVDLRDLRWNTGVKDSAFAFKVPRGVEVLEVPGEGG